MWGYYALLGFTDIQMSTDYRPLHILMLSEDFIPNVGGVSQHVYHLSRALASRGHQVVVVGGRRSPTRPDYPVTNGLRLLSVKPSGAGKMRHLGFMIVATLNVLEILRERRMDVVHWHGLWSDNMVARVASWYGNPLRVFTNHSSMFYGLTATGAGRWLLSKIITRPDVCIAPSQDLANRSRDFFRNVPVTYIPNGVDLEHYRNLPDKATAKAELGLDPLAIVVTAPRRLEPKNGIEYLIRAIPSATRGEGVRVLFCIAGDGSQRPLLERLTATLGVDPIVRFLGSVPPMKMRTVYAASDIVVIPSLIEATSLAALEALACGVPVIGTRVGGLVDILGDTRAGLLVPPRSPEALARALRMLLEDERERRSMSVAAAEVAKGFSWDSIAERTEKLYFFWLNRQAPR